MIQKRGANHMQKKRIVLKIGGKSLSSGKLIRRAAKLIAKEQESNEMIVVVSAPGNMTSSLIGILNDMGSKINPKAWDHALSYGEIISASLLAAELENLGIKYTLFDPMSPSWPIITDSNFGDANPLENKVRAICRKELVPLLRGGRVIVIPGFVGKTAKNEISTMGRGSSDLSAFLIAKCIAADEIIKVSDVDGVYLDGKKVDSMSLGQLMRICSNGQRKYEKPYSIIQLKALSYFNAPTIARVVSYKDKNIHKSGTVIYASESL